MDAQGGAVDQRPLLILVSGAPATGKTTLASQLADALAIPHIPRDAITEIMAASFDVQTHEQSKSLLQPMFAVYYDVLRQLLSAGISLVTDSNFHRGISEQDLKPCIALSRPVMIFCETSLEQSVARFIARSQCPERWFAFDEDRIAELQSGYIPDSWTNAQPLNLDIPLLRVDTNDSYNPLLDEIIAFIQSI